VIVATFGIGSGVRGYLAAHELHFFELHLRSLRRRRLSIAVTNHLVRFKEFWRGLLL